MDFLIVAKQSCLVQKTNPKFQEIGIARNKMDGEKLSGLFEQQYNDIYLKLLTNGILPNIR